MAGTAPSTSTALTLDATFLVAFRTGKLTKEQAEEFARRDPHEIAFLLLQLSMQVSGVASTPGANTPSGAIPPYAKPNSKPSTTHGKRGAKPGHEGATRPKPPTPDRQVEHTLPQCPCCQGPLKRTGRVRRRLIEDIPANLKAEVTEHTIHRDWCPRCRKQVEPIVSDALPDCQLGHRTAALTAWLHYGLGTTTSQIVTVLNGHLKMKITEGGLTQIWHRLASVLQPWYQQIHNECIKSAVLHADETSWRTSGLLCWLWVFACQNSTYYMIHPSRGHEALWVFFTEAFAGVLVTDFWKAYDVITKCQQKCWPHLLRELKKIDEGPENTGDWPEFSKKLWRIYGDAIRLQAGMESLAEESFQSRVGRLNIRLTNLAFEAWTNPHAQRLANRLKEYGDDLLRFVEIEGVPSSNNKAEQEIRPAVVMRKASYGSGSDKGAQTRSVLMSIFRTLKQRGLDPLVEVETALKQYTLTKQLPPLPAKTSSSA